MAQCLPHVWLQELSILTGLMSYADADKVSPASDSAKKVAHGENLLRYWLRPIKRLGVDAGACNLSLEQSHATAVANGTTCVRAQSCRASAGCTLPCPETGLCCLQPTCSRHSMPRQSRQSCERSSQTSLQQRSPSLHPLRCAVTVVWPGGSMCMACTRPLARQVIVKCCAHPCCGVTTCRL